MINNDQIKDRKVQFDINRKVAKIAALSSRKIGMNILRVKKYYLLIKTK